MNKWEVDEHKQWSEKVRSQRFCPPLLDKAFSNSRRDTQKPPLAKISDDPFSFDISSL